MHAAAWLFSALPSIVFAQYQFTVPDQNQSDLSESWSVGETIKISWLKGWHGVGDELPKADLWITWFRTDSFSQLLQQNITFDNAGSLSWTVNVSNEVVKTDPQFVFRLKPHSDPPIYTATENESPSRGFLLLPGVQPTSSSSSSSVTSSTTSSASSSSSTTFTLNPSSSPTEPAKPDDKSSTPLGAILGGVFGGLAFLIALLILALFLLKKKRQQREQKVYASEGRASAWTGQHTQSEYYAYRQPAVEADGRHLPAELENDSRKTYEVSS